MRESEADEPKLRRSSAASDVYKRQPLSSDNGDLGTLVNREDNSLLLVLNEDPPQGQVYQAWEIAEGSPQSLGTWDGRVLDVQTALAQDSLFGVSIEPSGGSEQPTSTPILVVPLAS